MPQLKAFIQIRWKALMPLLALGLSTIIDVASKDVSGYSGWKPLALVAASSVLVYLKRNTPAVAIDVPGEGPNVDADRGEIGLAVLFLIVALVCFVIFTLAAHGTIATDEAFTWLGAGLVFATLAKLVP